MRFQCRFMNHRMFQYLQGFCLFILFVGLLSSVPLYGQVDYSTATLKGTVMDPQGAVIPGVNVSATNAKTGITRSAQTESQGRYQIPALPPGPYQINFEKQGFTKEVVKDVEITVGQSVIYDA